MLRLYVPEESEQLIETVRRLGYSRIADQPQYISEYSIGALPAAQLPSGFELRSMANDNDIRHRSIVLARAFGNTEPSGAILAALYEELQRAPDYQADLDIYIVAPSGSHVAFCIAWYDRKNNVGSFEPVGTDPDYRQKGGGRTVILEGLRRLAALGAVRAYVGSGQPFYNRIGFALKYRRYWRQKTFY